MEICYLIFTILLNLDIIASHQVGNQPLGDDGGNPTYRRNRETLSLPETQVLQIPKNYRNLRITKRLGEPHPQIREEMKEQVAPPSHPLANFQGFANSVKILKDTTIALNTDKPKNLRCGCWASLEFLANQLTPLTLELQNVFTHPPYLVTRDLLHWFHNSHNSALHLVRDVWQSPKVTVSLNVIKNISIWMKNNLAPYKKKPVPQDILNELPGVVARYIKYVNILNEGTREYWPQKRAVDYQD